MKVNVSYNIDLEEVTLHVIGLLEKSVEKLETAEVLTRETISMLTMKKDTKDILVVIDNFRKMLADIDSSFANYSVILAQASKAELELHLQKMEEPVPDTKDYPYGDEIMRLEELRRERESPKKITQEMRDNDDNVSRDK